MLELRFVLKDKEIRRTGIKEVVLSGLDLTGPILQLLRRKRQRNYLFPKSNNKSKLTQM